jgi:hypothetical protein
VSSFRFRAREELQQEGEQMQPPPTGRKRSWFSWLTQGVSNFFAISPSQKEKPPEDQLKELYALIEYNDKIEQQLVIAEQSLPPDVRVFQSLQ